MAIKYRKRISTSLSNENYDYLCDICEKNLQTQSTIIEIGLGLVRKELEQGKSLADIIQKISNE